MKGHIRKRGTNSWEIKLDTDRVDGQRKTIYRNVKGSKREAQATLAKLITEVESGGHVEPHKLTVIQHVRNRVALWRANGITSPKTHERYEELIEYQIARFPIASRPLQKLTAADIEAWHSGLRIKGRHDGNGGVSTRTIHHAHKLLSKALREGARHGLVLKNVAVEERPPKIVTEAM